jgi:small subunit ribosomal protein S5
MNGLGREQSPRHVAARRGKKVADILPKAPEQAAEAQPAEA